MIGGVHDVQLPAGAQAQAIAGVWHWLLPTCTFVFVVLVVAVLVALWRAPWLRESAAPDVSALSKSEPKLARAVWGAVIVSTLLLLVLLAVSVFTDRALAQLPLENALHVELTGYQWWWEARYDDPDPSRIFTTANELHVPVGRPVIVTLVGADVIHSFWVPSLAGKQDLIPGRENDITIVPKKVGIYRGQCAEYCGAQHAHMALVVVVDSYPDFLKWWHHQLQPAPTPRTALTMAGYKYVTTGPCSACHSIGGTNASGLVAPDLTHLASRKSLAAGTMPMSEGNLYGWVEDAQSLKPGVKMPTLAMEPNKLHAVVAYLETLK